MNPIFIVGAPRSGNTLVRMILTTHSQICIPPESRFMQYIQPVFNNCTDMELCKKNILSLLFADHKFRDWELDYYNVEKYIAKSINLPYSDFIAGIYNLYNESVNKQCAQWGDKNPSNIYNVTNILELFPTSKIIITVREPLAIYGSLKRINFFNHDIKKSTAEFYKKIKCVAEYISNYLHNSSFIFISYAALVKNPEKITRELINTLGYKFEHNMLNFNQKQGYLSNMLKSKIKFHERLKESISDSYVDPLNYEIGPEDIDTIEKYLIDELIIIRRYINSKESIN